MSRNGRDSTVDPSGTRGCTPRMRHFAGAILAGLILSALQSAAHIQVHCYVQVDDIPVLQRPRIRYAVANHLVHGCADALWEAACTRSARAGERSQLNQGSGRRGSIHLLQFWHFYLGRHVMYHPDHTVASPWVGLCTQACSSLACWHPEFTSNRVCSTDACNL